MPWITTAYVDNVVGESVRHQLFSDGDGAFLQGVFDQFEESSRAFIRSRLQNSGYTVPDDLSTLSADTRNFLEETCMIFVLLKAFGRPTVNLEWPEVWAEYRQRAADILSGDAKVPGLDPAQSGAVGGAIFTDTRTGVSGTRPPVFGRDQLKDL